MTSRQHSPLVNGVVLAGGQSRRMFAGLADGGDKGLLEIAGKSMIAHVIDRFEPQVGLMAINANGDASRFSQFGCEVIADTVGGFVGPLAGVLAGMRWSQRVAPAVRWIATVSADAPLLPSNLVERLLTVAEGTDGGIAIAQTSNGLHSVIGLWPVELGDDLEAALRGGVRKVLNWTDKHGTLPTYFDALRLGERDIDPFFNANTPAELDELRSLLQPASGSSSASSSGSAVS